MKAELPAGDVPHVAFYNDPRVRALVYQLLVVLFVVLGGDIG